MDNICKQLSRPILCQVLRYSVTHVKYLSPNSPAFKYIRKYHDNPETYNYLAGRGQLEDIKQLSNWATPYTLLRVIEECDITDLILFRYVCDQIRMEDIHKDNLSLLYGSLSRKGYGDMIEILRRSMHAKKERGTPGIMLSCKEIIENALVYRQYHMLGYAKLVKSPRLVIYMTVRLMIDMYHRRYPSPTSIIAKHCGIHVNRLKSGIATCLIRYCRSLPCTVYWIEDEKVLEHITQEERLNAFKSRAPRLLVPALGELIKYLKSKI